MKAPSKRSWVALTSANAHESTPDPFQFFSPLSLQPLTTFQGCDSSASGLRAADGALATASAALVAAVAPDSWQVLPAVAICRCGAG